MPTIPAFCDNCHTPFSSGIFVDNCTNLFLGGNKSGPCPNCGSMGTVLEGVFNVFNNVIEVIDASSKSREQLSKYIEFLNGVKKENIDSESLKRKIEEDMPELSSIASYLPKTRNELYAFLALLVSLFSLVISLGGKPEGNTNNITINNVINEVLSEKSIKADNTPSTFSTPSRNNPCPCESGYKYKNCCGEII